MVLADPFPLSSFPEISTPIYLVLPTYQSTFSHIEIPQQQHSQFKCKSLHLILPHQYLCNLTHFSFTHFQHIYLSIKIHRHLVDRHQRVVHIFFGNSKRVSVIFHSNLIEGLSITFLRLSPKIQKDGIASEW